MIIDAATVDAKGDFAVFDKGLTNTGTIYLNNATDGLKVKLTKETYMGAVTEDEVTVNGTITWNGNRILRVNAGTETSAGSANANELTIALDEGELAKYDLVAENAVKSLYGNKANNGTFKSARFNDWLMTENKGLGDYDAVSEVADDVAAIAGTAGMVNVTMDALSQFNDTVSSRTSILARNDEGVNVWADVNGGKLEGKKVIAGAGYSSDIYAGVLGVDTTVACGAKIGAALTIGTADTDSKNTSAVTSMDSDLVDVSVYTSKTFGDIWNVAADIGYIQASNEVTTKAYNLGKFVADSNAFTFGIRGEVLTKAGALAIVPHAGLRYTRVDVDGFEAGFVTDYDAMNVFQMPVGVTVAGELEAAGWTIAPAFDLTFVPTWGDKNADLTIGINGASVKEAGTLRVLDSNVVNATLGVAAQNGARTFGLDYKLGVGSDDRMNNSFNARVNYAF